MHDEAEHQRPCLRPHDAQACGLGDDRTVRRVAAQDRRQRARTAVLLPDHAGDAQPAAQVDAGVAERLGRVERAAEAALHIHGSASVDPASPDGRVPRRRRPGGFVAHRHDVDVAVEQQVPARPVLPDPAHDSERVVALDLVGPVGVPFELLEVDVPDVGVEALARQPGGDSLLRRRLLPVEARERDQFPQERDDPVDVERCERSPFRRAQPARAHSVLTRRRARPGGSDRSVRLRP